MPGLNQNANGKWTINNLCHKESENLSFQVVLKYGDISVQAVVNKSGTTNSYPTNWETPLGSAITTSAIQLVESEHILSQDGTKNYYIDSVTWENVVPYSPEPVITYEFVVSGGSASSNQGYTTVGAWYITKTDGRVTNTQDVTNSTTWEVTAGGSVATASTTTKGRITYNNPSTTDDVGVTVRGTYNGESDTTSFTVPKKAHEPVITHEFVVSGGSASASAGTTNVGSWYITKTDGTVTDTQDVTTATTWEITAGGTIATASTSTKGRIDFSNTGTTQITVTVKGTYSGQTGTTSFSVPARESVVTYEFVVSGGSASTNEGYTNVGSWYITKTDGVVTKTENATSATTWSITAGSSVATASTSTKGRIDYDNESTASTVNVTVKGVYGDYSGTTSFTVPKKSYEPVITYEFVVSGQTSTGEVPNYSGTTYVGAWYITRTDGTITNTENVTNSTTWSITQGSSVATASTTNKGRIDYENLDISTSVGVTVKGVYNSYSGSSHFNVPACTARGYINLVGNITVASVITAATEELECFDIVLSSLTATNTSSDSWITRVYVQSGSPYVLRIEATSNREGTSSRTGSIVVTGNDIFGNVITAATTFTQREPSPEDIPCTAMTIEPHGSITIEDPENSQHFDVYYEPTFTSQHGAVWSLTNTTGGSVSSNIAHLEEDSDPSLYDVRHLVVGTGATGQTLHLKATNSYNSSIVSNTVVVTVRYVGAGNISISGSSVDAGFGDDRIDTTNGAPYVTATNLRGSLAWRVLEENSFIRTVEITNGRVLIYFTGVNLGPQRTATVRLYDSAAPDTYGDIRITQRAYVEPDPNEVSILAIAGENNEGELQPLEPQRVRFAVMYTNNDIVSQSFSSITYSITGKNSSDGTTFSKLSQSLPTVTVDPLSSMYQVYTINNVEPTGPTTSYNMFISCYTRYQWINDTVTGWQGDDPIDTEPEGDTH